VNPGPITWAEILWAGIFAILLVALVHGWG